MAANKSICKSKLIGRNSAFIDIRLLPRAQVRCAPNHLWITEYNTKFTKVLKTRVDVCSTAPNWCICGGHISVYVIYVYMYNFCSILMAISTYGMRWRDKSRLWWYFHRLPVCQNSLKYSISCRSKWYWLKSLYKFKRHHLSKQRQLL